MTTFSELGLNEPILKALDGEGYTTPTPIQAQAIPLVMAGHDLLGIAQTGTGKTAAFALPILHRMALDKRPAPAKGCRVLVLSPTRELAGQIAESFRVYGKNTGFRCAVIFGGVSMNRQIQEMQRGVDVLVATPGRLMDLIGQRAVDIGRIEVLVLDEADQMLDMGFIHAIRKLVKLIPAKRQSLFFSATMPKEIAELAGSLLRDPVRVAVTPVATTAERVDQHVIFVDTQRKQDLLHRLLADDPSIARALVFSRTKHGADRVVRRLEAAGFPAAAIHGNKSQNARERALADFKAGRSRLLVATDIAARGIDVEGVTHVVNYDLPNIPESYVHRIGRTARAGAAGIAISFCAGDERAFLRDIERVTRQKVPVAPPPAGFLIGGPADAADPKAPRGEERERSGPQGRNGRPSGGRPGGQRSGAPRGERSDGGSRTDSRPARSGEGRAAGPAGGRDDRRPAAKAPQAARPRDAARPSTSDTGGGGGPWREWSREGRGR